MSNSMAQNVTGYGSARNRLCYDGDESKYELWEIKFLGHLRLQNLLADFNKPTPDAEQNARIFSELVLVLDDKSLSLIIRDAKDKGKEAIGILREHYLGKSKPRIISLYGELASLKMAANETVTEYIIRAEKYATALKSADEIISDSLLIAMVLKGLPSNFNSFSTVITQRDDKVDFVKFKACLRSFEESEHSRSNYDQDNVMKFSSNSAQKITCFSCGEQGHKKYQCPKKNTSVSAENKQQKTKRWCESCKSRTHDTKYCRNNSAKSMRNHGNSDEHSYAFKTVCENVNYCDNIKLSDSLLVDSGATAHIICNRDNFIEFDEHFDPKNHYIELADGVKSNNVVKARGKAKVNVIDVNGNKCDFLLQNALYVPSYAQNIFSVQAATENGASVNFSENDAFLKTKFGAKFDIVKRGKLYFLYNIKSSSVTSKNLSEWHQIFGHCNVQDLIKLETSVIGMKISDKQNHKNFKCDICVLGKMSQHRNRLPDVRATAVLELVHCDLAGPVTPTARDGFEYAINFVDDFSGTIFIYFLKNKNDAYKALQQFLADSAPYGTIKRLKCDNGGEFQGNFRNLVRENKIKQEFSSPHSPHQNGTSERAWRTIFDMTRCLLLDASLPKSLWTYAARYAAFIRNRCFNARLGMTPYEAVTGRKPNVNKVEIFGSKCFAYVQNKRKLDDRSKEVVFVGFDNISPAYLVYIKEENYVRRVRCVEFTSKSIIQDEEENCYFYPKSNETVYDSRENPPAEQAKSKPTKNDRIQSDRNEEPRYPRRDRKKPGHLQDYNLGSDDEFEDAAACARIHAQYSIDYCYMTSAIPRTYREAINSTESDEWKAAMDEEISNLCANNTYTLTPKPSNKNIIGARWVYDIKPGIGNIPKYKARFVAKGFSQVKERDFDETFSPTAKLTSLRTMLQISAQHDMILHTMDVKAAYLNADLDFELYINQPEGYEIYSNEGVKLVCKLNKSLYGLKQSGRNWNSLLDDFLKVNNFTPSYVDPCMYTMISESSVIICLIWVDDLLICSDNKNEMDRFKKLLCDRFKMKDIGKLEWFLGIKFEYEKNCIKMSQADFIERILIKFSMQNSIPRTLPCDVNINKFDNEDSKRLENPKIYREIVGSLIYLMTCSRPDISYVVSKLSQYMNKPTEAHLRVARNVLKYLKGSIDNKLCYRKSNEGLKLIGYCDSDWGGSEDRKSISGYCYKLCVDGALISWKTRKQNVVSLSSCEAEYTALSFAIKEGLYLSQLFADLYSGEKSRFDLYVDNQGAINLANNPVYHQRTKHISIKYHFIRHEIKQGNVKLLYIESKNNIADIFTKAVPRPLLNSFNIFALKL